MKRLPTVGLLVLLCFLLLPLLSLLGTSLRLFVPPSVSATRRPDGTRTLGIVLQRDQKDRDRGTGRILGSDGVVRSDSGISSPAEVDDSAWVVLRDDGPPVLGHLVAVVPGEPDTLRGEAAAKALTTMPDRIRSDRNRLLHGVREARGRAKFAVATRRWELAEAWDRRMVAVLEDLDGSRRVVRLSSAREAWRSPRSTARAWLAVPGRILSCLLGPPDSWTGGGLLPVVEGTLFLILLAGIVGGIPALLAAVRIADRTEQDVGARWVRRAAAWFTAVPGVVWGAIGAGILVGRLGASLDGLLGTSSWGVGGMLWGAITLGALSAPTTLSRALIVIDRVPRSSRAIARSCGATRWQVLRWVILPEAWRGLVGAWFSGLARAAGETAPLLMVGAARSLGGRSFGSMFGWQTLSGGFLHLGVVACDPPWPSIESEFGHPLAFLSISVLAALCLGLEFAALRFSRASVEVRE